MLLINNGLLLSLEGSGSRTKYNQAMGQMLDYAKSQGMLNK